jgi:hypothetical protein
MDRNNEGSHKQKLFFFNNAWLLPKLPSKGQIAKWLSQQSRNIYTGLAHLVLATKHFVLTGTQLLSHLSSNT